MWSSPSIRLPKTVSTAVVNYSSVVKLVREHLREGRFQLIETAAMTTAHRIAEAFSLACVRVRVTKPAAASDAPLDLRGFHPVGVTFMWNTPPATAEQPALPHASAAVGSSPG